MKKKGGVWLTTAGVRQQPRVANYVEEEYIAWRISPRADVEEMTLNEEGDNRVLLPAGTVGRKYRHLTGFSGRVRAFSSARRMVGHLRIRYVNAGECYIQFAHTTFGAQGSLPSFTRRRFRAGIGAGVLRLCTPRHYHVPLC